MDHLNMDDLLKELDDLPGASKRAGRVDVVQHCSSVPGHGAHANTLHGATWHAGAANQEASTHSVNSSHARGAGHMSSSAHINMKLMQPHPPPSSKPYNTLQAAGGRTTENGRRLSLPGGPGNSSVPNTSYSPAPHTSQRSVSGTAADSSHLNTKQHAHSTTTPPSLQKRNSLDELLDDLDVPCSTATGAAHKSATHATAAPPHHQRQLSNPSATSSPNHNLDSDRHPSFKGAKCMGLFLGGTAVPRGRNGTAIGVVHACESIRCTKCDFRVISFNDCAWAPDCDYLFFRNNYPTDTKLATKMRPEPSACAYCCQCSWTVIKGADTRKVDAYAGELRWVCAGHV